jgi:hypothetical protein
MLSMRPHFEIARSPPLDVEYNEDFRFIIQDRCDEFKNFMSFFSRAAVIILCYFVRRHYDYYFSLLSPITALFYFITIPFADIISMLLFIHALLFCLSLNIIIDYNSRVISCLLVISRNYGHKSIKDRFRRNTIIKAIITQCYSK